jgi:hypothetical protein
MNSSVVWEMKSCRSLLAARFMLAFSFTHSSILKMESKFSSEMSVDFQRTTRRYSPEEITLHNRLVSAMTTPNIFCMEVIEIVYIFYSYMSFKFEMVELLQSRANDILSL